MKSFILYFIILNINFEIYLQKYFFPITQMLNIADLNEISYIDESIPESNAFKNLENNPKIPSDSNLVGGRDKNLSKTKLNEKHKNKCFYRINQLIFGTNKILEEKSKSNQNKNDQNEVQNSVIEVKKEVKKEVNENSDKNNEEKTNTYCICGVFKRCFVDDNKKESVNTENPKKKDENTNEDNEVEYWTEEEEVFI